MASDPLTVIIDDIEYAPFVSVEVHKSIETFAGTFRLVAASSNTNTFPINRSSTVKISYQGMPLINGVVDTLAIDYSDRDHTITATGRDLTRDIIDSTLTNIELPAKFDLKFAIQKVLDQLGITNLAIRDLTTGINPFTSSTQGHITTNKQSQTGFNFINTYAKKRQVLVTVDGNSNIILTRVDSPPPNGEVINSRNGRENNVLSASIKYADNNRFNKYIGLSQFNPSANPNSGTSGASGTNLTTQVIDSQIPPTRQYVFTPDSSFNTSNLKDRALWEANIRKSRSQAYSVKTLGFESSMKTLWFPGQQVKVKDEFASIDANMIISAVTYSVDLQGGTTSNLTLVPLDAFKLQIEEEKRKAQTQQVGNANDKFNT